MRRLLLLVFTLPLWAVETVWVHKSYVGGPLCAKGGPEINFVAPGIEATAEPLRAINIRIARSYFRNLPTCQACGKCPTYKREILFEIEADKITAAEKAGFLRLPNAPAADELAEFERSKVYRPPSDLPAED